MSVVRTTILGASAVVVAVTAWGYWRPTPPPAHAAALHDVASATARPESSEPPSGAAPIQSGTGPVASHLTLAQAHQEFGQGAKCYYAQIRASSSKSVADSCRASAAKQGDATAKSCERIEKDLDEAASDLQNCSDAAATPRHFYEVTKAAAAAGDPDAQACYIQGQFRSGGQQMPFTQQDVEDYLHNAPPYINAALARGDWRVVALLARHGATDEWNPLKLITKDDAYQAYLMNRLLQLGAEGAYAQMLRNQSDAVFLMPRMSQGPMIAPDQAAKADKEAQALFHKSFDHQPLLKQEPRICTSS